MSKLFDKLFRFKTLLIILIVVLIGFLFTLWNRSIYIDDAWFGEQAYWFSKDGIPRTETIKEYFKWDEHLLVYHKLNIIIGAGIVKIFGWSVNYFRGFTLAAFIIFVIIFIRYQRSFSASSVREKIIVSIFFLFANPLIIYLGFTYRPEILVMALGFLSWIFLEKGWQPGQRGIYFWVAGLFAGLAFFAHLNGMIYAVAGGVLLLYRRDFKQLGWFIAGCIITASLFFYDLWQPGRMELFLYQIRNWPDQIGGNYLSGGFSEMIKNLALKLSQEHQRFFWSDKVWVLSISFFLTLILFFRTILTRHRNLLIYAITLILSLNLFGSHIAERYIIYYLPFMALIIAEGISETTKRGKPWIKAIFVLLIIAQLLFCAKMVYSIVGKNKDYVAMHQNIMSKIPDKSALTLVDYPFVFNALTTHNLISFKTFEYYEATQQMKYNRERLLFDIQKLNVKYIIVALEKNIIENKNFFELFIDQQGGYDPYEIYFEGEGYLILRHPGIKTNKDQASYTNQQPNGSN